MVFLVHTVQLSVVSAVPNNTPFTLQERPQRPTKECSRQVHFVFLMCSLFGLTEYGVIVV